jgi:periplasmic protein TonB
MGHASAVVEPTTSRTRSSHSPLLFQSLVLTQPDQRAGRKSATLAASVAIHGVLVLAIAILPLLFYDAFPCQETLKAFFVTPLEVVPPPPPPPPPPAGARAVVRPAPRAVTLEPQAFVAPIDVPTEIKPEETLDLGIEGGIEGGVEGGVPGGVVGGVVGGLPQAPPPPARIVRIGGQIAQPKLLRKVNPVYPELALQARATGVVVLDAEVDMRGYVRKVTLKQSAPLFDAAAIAAVKQWRYQPLLLNGEPTAFILTVTLQFNLEIR